MWLFHPKMQYCTRKKHFAEGKKSKYESVRKTPFMFYLLFVMPLFKRQSLREKERHTSSLSWLSINGWGKKSWADPKAGSRSFLLVSHVTQGHNDLTRPPLAIRCWIPPKIRKDDKFKWYKLNYVSWNKMLIQLLYFQ